MSDDAQDPFLHDPQAFERMIDAIERYCAYHRRHESEMRMATGEDLERHLAELAAYHVGLFTGAASRIDSSPSAIAHALSLLIEEAKQRRPEYRA
jgi:hypothetical protein